MLSQRSKRRGYDPLRYLRLPAADGAMLRPSTIGKLRVPSGAIRGTVEDVARVLPLLTELSVGARRGIPRWVPTASPGLSVDDLIPRERSASWLEITYPFSTDDELRDKYMIGGDDTLRAGMFLEELDAFSADCSARHADAANEARPLSVVTAAHDGLSIFERLSARHDLRLRGSVVSVGTSSMEVRTDLLRVLRSTKEADEEDFLGCCYTVMVARERGSFSKAAVHPLLAQDTVSDSEARAASTRRAAARKQLAANALYHKPPSPTEVPLLHELWRDARREADAADGAEAPSTRSDGDSTVVRVPMRASEQIAVDVMQPSHRNMNGYMFGGYLMRRAYEVAWLSAYRFGRAPPNFAGLDDVSFNTPIELGAIIELIGRAVYAAEDETLRVCVEAHKLSLRTGKREPANLFHFIFRPSATAEPPESAPGGVDTLRQDVPPVYRREVLPETYEEGMLYLEGRRRWLNSLSEEGANACGVCVSEKD